MLEKNSDLRLMKMQIYFIVKKNLDLHLMKMWICFCELRKMAFDL